MDRVKILDKGQIVDSLARVKTGVTYKNYLVNNGENYYLVIDSRPLTREKGSSHGYWYVQDVDLINPHTEKTCLVSVRLDREQVPPDIIKQSREQPVEVNISPDFRIQGLKINEWTA